MPASSFSYDGVHVFLTYPQCPLEREQLRDFLLEISPDCAYIIGRELHDDGNYHLHAYVHFGGRRRFTSERAFDVEGYHPNIQKPRRRDDCIAYCRKEDLEPLVSDNLREVQKSTNGWGDLLQVSRRESNFLKEHESAFRETTSWALSDFYSFASGSLDERAPPILEEDETNSESLFP